MLNLFQQQLFLYQTAGISLSEFEISGRIDTELPDSITQNLNPAFEIRSYQEEAFARFIRCFNKDFEGKCLPLHLLFNHGDRQRQNAYHGRFDSLPLRAGLPKLSLFRQFYQHH